MNDNDQEPRITIGPIRERSGADDLWNVIAEHLPPNMQNEKTARRIGFLIGWYGVEAVVVFLQAFVGRS